MSTSEQANALASNIQQVVKGKPDAVRLVLVALLAEGHVLIEDVPGVGKTTLARALAHSISGTWGRVQFTPDLLPADVTGTNMPEPGNQVWTFHPGPVFANIVIADEINRASPKTQSAMLQVMEERTVTVDRKTHSVPRPFVVVATQNPVEMDGTYRLPEAQLDRFLMRITMDYPSRDATLEIMRGYRSGRELDDLRSVVDTREVAVMIEAVEQVHVSDAVAGYIVDLAEASRKHPAVEVGVSPRGCLALMRAGRAAAALAGRDFVEPEDVKDLATAVLAHRLILTPQSDLDGVKAVDVVGDLLGSVKIPRVQTF